MGYFGTFGNSGAQGKQEEDTYTKNQAEIEKKRKDLYQQRLDIIKGQAGQVWTPKR
jgi:hypothetical protein